MDEPAAREGEAGPADERGWDEFAPLYDEHHERLYRVALLLCHGDTALAEDAVTETFLRVFEQWKHGKVENFFPFARQVLVQQVLGARRDGRAAPRRPPATSAAPAATTLDHRRVLDVPAARAAGARGPHGRRAALLRGPVLRPDRVDDGRVVGDGEGAGRRRACSACAR